MASELASQDLEDDGSGFNPIVFAQQIYNNIRPLCSQYSSYPGVLIESPTDIGGGSARGEHLMNAFFRMLGLPATRSEEFLTRENNKYLSERFKNNKKKQAALSQDGTLNYFSIIDTITEGRDVIGDINSRTNILTKKKEATDYNTMMANPLLFSASIEPTNSRRASIFPLVVDASIPVYPLIRRMAPAFNDGNYIINENRLSRPFLEHVIYIRGKVLSGSNEDDNNKKELLDRINALRPETDKELTNVGSFKKIELIIQQRFLQCIKRLSFDYLKIKEDALRNRQKVRFVPNPVDNPDERSGQGSLPESEISSVTPDIDNRLNELKFALAKEEAIRFVLPTEAVNRSDNIRRILEKTKINNYKDDVLISDFTNLITYKEEYIRRQISEIEQSRQMALQEAEKIKRDLIYFTGEFTGLSIFDVIGVLYGLFTVDIKYLIGLLNEDAKNRLSKDKFFSFSPEEQSASKIDTERNPAILLSNKDVQIPTVGQSLAELQRKVEEAFLLAKTYASQEDRRPVRRRSVLCK